jgi:hypothetical protein
MSYKVKRTKANLYLRYTQKGSALYVRVRNLAGKEDLKGATKVDSVNKLAGGKNTYVWVTENGKDVLHLRLVATVWTNRYDDGKGGDWHNYSSETVDYKHKP